MNRYKHPGGWIDFERVVGDLRHVLDLVLFGVMVQRLLWPLARMGDTFDAYARARASAQREAA